MKILKNQRSDIEQLRIQVEALRRAEESLSKQTASLKKRNLRLAELNRVKDEFIAVASHQLRTPATGVKQYLGLLLEGYADPLTDNQKWFLQRANESNSRQLKIIDDLLQVARIDVGNLNLHIEDVDLLQLLDSSLSELQHKLTEKDLKIDYKKPAKKLIVRGDAHRLRMVLENILDNAINYSYTGRKIHIRLEAEPKHIDVLVRDEGVGIGRQDISKLFQKFSRIPNALSVEAGGTGLGLYWASKIMKLHGGSIEVDSEIDRGSTFKVKIPK